MVLLRWSVVMVLGLAGGSSPSTSQASSPPSQVAIRQVESAPAAFEARVEIGPAVVTIFDEAGRVIATE